MNTAIKSFIQPVYFIVLLSCMTSTGLMAQTYYGGAEIGLMMDRTHFVGDDGRSLSGGAPGGVVGINLAYAHKGFLFSTGVKRFRHHIRQIDLDRELLVFMRLNESTNFAESFVLPLQVAYDVKLTERWHLRMGVGIMFMYNRDAGYAFSTGIYRGVPVPYGSPQMHTADSTITRGRVDQRQFNLAFETSSQLLYRSKGGLDWFAGFSYLGHLHPLMQARNEFYGENIYRQGDLTVINALSVRVGLLVPLNQPK